MPRYVQLFKNQEYFFNLDFNKLTFNLKTNALLST